MQHSKKIDESMKQLLRGMDERIKNDSAKIMGILREMMTSKFSELM